MFLGVTPTPRAAVQSLIFAWADAGPNPACLRNDGARRIIPS